MNKYRVVKYISKKDHHWLDAPVKKGEIVFEYYGSTYGCISNDGIAVTRFPHKAPFFEVPISHIRLIKE